jgi:hypothetical protein
MQKKVQEIRKIIYDERKSKRSRIRLAALAAY